MNHFQTALEFYENCLKEHDNFYYHQACGSLYHHQNNLNFAEKELQRAVTLNEHNWAAQNDLSLVYYKRKDYRKAELELKAAIVSNYYNCF
jgi:Flp pilus assembly protein TadD